MVRALALQARGHWFESSCFHQNNRGFPLGFLLPSTAFCAAQRRAPFGRTRDKSLLTLAQTAPAASAPPLCVHAPPFGSVRLHPPSTRPIFFPRFALAVPSLRSLRVRLFPPKQPRVSLGFLLPSTALCAALRRAPFGRSRDKSLLTLAQTAPAASAPPLCVHAPPFGYVCLHPPSTRSPFFPVLLSLFRRSPPYESSCFHQKPTKQRFFLCPRNARFRV